MYNPYIVPDLEFLSEGEKLDIVDLQDFVYKKDDDEKEELRSFALLHGEPVPYYNRSLKKDNRLIGTKYRASMLERQINYLNMLSIQENNFIEKGGEIIVAQKASVIKEKIGNSSGSFYTKLKQVASDMTANNIGYVDDENETFAFMSPVNYAWYEKGIFYTHYSSRMKDRLVGVSKNYTMLPEQTIMSFKISSSYPMYSYLKKYCYYPNGYKGERNNVFMVEIGLSELKLELGVVNVNIPAVRRFLDGCKGTEADYDKAVEICPDKMYNTWAKFKNQCLDPTIKEINEKSELYVEYTTKNHGKGGKVHGIQFIVYLNGAESKQEESKNTIPMYVNNDGNIVAKLDDSQRFVLALEAAEILAEEKFSYSTVVSICESANYSIDSIKEKYQLLKKQTKIIENPAGWLIDSLKNNYPIPTNKKNSNNKKNKFADIPKHDYDYNELEKLLLNTTIN